MAVAKQDGGSKKNTETKTQTVSVGGRDVSTKNAPKPTYTSKAQNVNSNPTVGGRQLSNRQVATDLVNQAKNNYKPVQQKTQRQQEANPYKKSYTEDDYNNLKNTLYNSAEDPYYDMMWSNVEYKDMWTPEAQKEFDDYNNFMNKVGEEAQVAKGDVATQKEIKDTQGNYKLNDVIDYTKNQWKDFSQDLTKYEAEQRDLIAKNQQYESLMEQLGDGEEYQKYKAESDITKNRLDELDGLIGDIKGRQAYQNALQKRLTFEDLRANGSKDEFLEYSKYAGSYMNNLLDDIALNYEASQFRKLAGVQTFIENVKQSFGDKEAQRITDTITKLYNNGDVTEEEKDEVLAYAQNIVDRNTTKPGESIGVQLNDIANQLSMMQENGETATEKLFVDVVGNVLDNSIGQLGPAIAFGRAGMLASTALMSMSGYTQTYQQDIEAGFTHEQAQLDALFQSGVEFLTELIGGERILRFAEGEVLPRTFGQMVVEGFKSGFAESTEEGLGWGASPIAHYMATGEVPSIESWNPEELKQAVVTAFLAGFVQAEMSADYSQFGMEAPLSATEQTLKNFLTITTDEGKNRVQDLITELNVMGRDASWRKNIQLADGTKISESQYINMVKDMAELSLNEYNDKIQVKGVEIINENRVDPIMSLAEDSKYSLKDCLEVTRQDKINSLMQSLNAGEVIQTINEQYEQDVAKKMVAQESERLAEIQKQLDKDGVKVKAPMWEQMNDEAKTNATIVSKVSDLIGGTPIEFADLRTKDGKIVDGFYDDGKIVVNPNAKLGAISTFIHEYTHGIEANKFYAELRNEVKFLYGRDYQTLVNGIKKEYSNIKKLSQEDAERELTAKTVQKMLGNKKFVERLVKYHTDMAYKMYTDLKSMTTYSTVAESMAQTFLKAFKGEETEIERKYDDAVKNGDMKKAQELVKQYAVLRGYSPEQFYHATASEGFNEFDKSKIKALETDADYNGFWVSTSPDTSPSFRNANKVYPLYIKYGNIAPADVIKRVQKEVKKEWRNPDRKLHDEARSLQDEVRLRLEDMGYNSIVFDDKVNINVDELEKTGATEWENAKGAKYRLEYDEERSQEVGEDAYLLYYWSNGQGDWMWTQEDYFGTPKEIADEINTYRHGEKVVVLFEPNQLKSSAPVEYDDNGNVIPLNKRFDDSTNDLRYSYNDQEYMDAVNSGDMEEAQRLADEQARRNGYDIKAYHSTNAEFTKFDKEKQGTNFNNYLHFGSGFYFGPTAEETKRYGKKTMSVYLSADRLLDVGKPVENEKAYQYLIDNGYHPADAKFAMNYGDRFINALYDTLLDKYSQGGANVQVQSLLKEFGYDGIDAVYGVNNDKGQVVVFEPSQIKSADPVVYDDNGNIIPLSERFNSSNDDIRYSYDEEDGRFHTGNTTVDEMMNTIIDSMSEEEFRKFLDEGEFDYATQEEVEDDPKVQDEGLWVKDPEGDYIKIDDSYTSNGKTVAWKDERIDALIEENEKKNFAFSGHDPYQYHYAIKLSPKEYEALSYLFDPRHNRVWREEVATQPENYGTGEVTPEKLGGWAREYNDENDPRRYRYKRKIDYMFFDASFENGMLKIKEQEGNHRALILENSGYESMPILLGTDFPLRGPVTLRGMNAGDIRNPNFKELSSNDYVELVKANRDRLIEKFGSGSKADISYSFDGEEDAKKYYATIAPYLDTRLNENNRQELIDRAEKAYDGVAKEIAKSLGISPAPKTENIGGYENNEGQKLRELSWTFDLGEIDSTKARLFTSLMGDLAFENQEAVICMRYLDENEGDHKVGEKGEDGGTYGKEYGFQFKDLKTVEESLLKADIANYNIDRESNYLKVQDFGFDPNFDQKLDILLEGNNYESAEERPIYSYYLSRESRQSLYETQLKTKEGVREGNESDLSGRQVEEANRRVSDVIKNGQNSPFLRRAEAQDNERSDLEFTEKDLKNYNVIRPTTERKYSEDKNIDKETGVLSPKFITELDATVGRTTRKAEIDDAENYAEMVATQLDNGADPEDVLNQIKEEPLNNGVIRALTIGQVLADRGLYDEMHELAQWARDTDRLAGQLIESNKHLYQLDNEMSRSIYLTKVEQNLIDEYNAKFKRKSDIDIEETVHKIFSDAFEATVKSKTVREFRDAVGALARQVNKAMPKTVWDRIRQYRMISMLSGPKTAVSNFVSNVATHGLYRMNNFNQAILEMAMKDITVRSVDDVKKFAISDDQRNTTLRKNREVSKRNKRYADKIWEQIDKGAKSKYGDDVEKIPDIIKNSKAYKTKTQYNTVGFKAKSLAGKALDLVQSVQAYMLDDSPIAKLAFRDRFNDICQARNIDVRTLDPNSKQFSSVVDSAFDYAEEVVSHNATAISKTLANIQKYSSTNVRVDKDSLTKGVDEAIKLIKERANKGESMYVLLDGTLRKMEDWFVPFYKTNASLMQKALQFSPLEWAQVKNDYDKVKAGRMDLVDMVDHMSKAVTGTTLYMLGAIFAYLGWLKWDKDDEDYSGRLAIKIPGTNIGYTADFLDPISTIFAKGVVLAQELMENGVSFTTLQKLAGDYGDIFLNDEMDMFSSMKDFFDTVGKVQKGEDDYGEYTIADGATDTAFTILNSYIPALMRDISRVIDPAKKSTYDNSNMKYLFNRLLNSTPFRTKLADKKDATGRTINYTQPFTGNDVFDRILTQMVSKGKLVDMEGKAVTTRSDNGNLGEKADEMSQMAQDFQFNDANGDGYSDTHWIRDTVPANIYPGGEQVQLNSEERDEYGKTWTDVWTSGAKSLFNNDVYKGLDYEKQADVVYELQGFARECIEADYCLEHNIDPTKAQKTALAIRDFCTTNGKIDGKKLGLIALGTAKENKLANGGQRYVLGKRDENGKTITNSRQLYMRQLYEQAGIYDEIVKAVAENDNLSYQDFGLGKTVVEKYSADTAKSKYAEIYGAVMAKASDSSNKKTSSSGAKKSSRKSSGSSVSGGSSGIRKAGKLNKLAPVTSRNVINDNKIANGATNFMKAYASVFNRSGKKPSSGGSAGSVTCPRCGSTVSSSNGKCPVCGANL